MSLLHCEAQVAVILAKVNDGSVLITYVRPRKVDSANGVHYLSASRCAGGIVGSIDGNLLGSIGSAVGTGTESQQGLESADTVLQQVNLQIVKGMGVSVIGGVEELVAAQIAVNEGCIGTLGLIVGIGDYLSLGGVFVVHLGDEFVCLDIADSLVAKHIGLLYKAGNLVVEGQLSLDGGELVKVALVNIAQIPCRNAIEVVGVVGHNVALLAGAGAVAFGVIGDVTESIGNKPLQRAYRGDGLLCKGVS